MSQGHYPLKGLHMVVDALKYVKLYYPDIKLVVIGKDVYKQPFYRITAYQKYIRKMIDTYELRSNIQFVPQMSADEMAATILESRVFINPSSVENSSNSLGEAMLIGCPCIASNVGGANSFVSDGDDGFLYPFNEPYTLADRIMRLLSDDELSVSFSEKSRHKASKIYNRRENYQMMMRIYTTIHSDSEEDEIH